MRTALSEVDELKHSLYYVEKTLAKRQEDYERLHEEHQREKYEHKNTEADLVRKTKEVGEA